VLALLFLLKNVDKSVAIFKKFLATFSNFWPFCPLFCESDFCEFVKIAILWPFFGHFAHFLKFLGTFLATKNDEKTAKNGQKQPF
jgi:hypothetical protein